ALVFLPDGKTVVKSGHGLQRWNVITGEPILGRAVHANEVGWVVTTPSQQQLISASWDDALCIWDLTEGKLQHRESLQGKVVNFDYIHGKTIGIGDRDRGTLR